MLNLFKKMITSCFSINESYFTSPELENFINSLDYENLEKNHILYKNTRNTVYSLEHPKTKEELILKRSKPGSHYTVDRVISHYLRNLFKHYGKKAFNGAELLRKNDVPTLTPLAYWKKKIGFMKYESCFLCNRIDTSYSVRDFLEKEYVKGNSSHELIKKELIDQMCALIRKIHNRNLLHGDLIINNFLVKENNKGRHMIVIDTDHVRHNILPSKLLKRFFAINCLCRMNFSEEDCKLFLKNYLQNDYRPFWYRVLRFWRWWDLRPLKKIRWQIKDIIGIKKTSVK